MEMYYLIFGIAAVFAVLMYLLFSKLNRKIDSLSEKSKEQESASVMQLSQRIEALNRQVGESLQKVTETVLQQVAENTRRVDSRLEFTQRSQAKSEKEIQRIIREVTAKLSAMQESNKKIFEVGKDIASLQEILHAPKLRGTIGELFLGDLLSQIFPANRYVLQYTFKSGETVDAVLKLRDGHLVPIDAKFPLESFQRMIAAEDEAEKKSHRRDFVKSVKRRIDEISSKYILTDEGTLDFALMYIPAENVYYETILKNDSGNDLMSYAYSKKVIPVSPNNLYVYLQTIALGLRGMKIEERAKEILQDLSRLNADFAKVAESYEVLGKHLNHARAKYEDTSRLLGKFGGKIEEIESKTDTQPTLISETEST